MCLFTLKKLNVHLHVNVSPRPLTPVLSLATLLQPARQGLKYVMPSEPQTGAYSWILQPQFTLQPPVRFLWVMVSVGLEKENTPQR